MSEQEQERPLTRREMRMREQAAREAAGIEASESASETEQAQVEEPLPEESPDRAAAEELVSEIEISPLNEDGTPRSRREIRQLREAALAELLGDQEEAAPEEPADEEVNEAPAAEPEAEGEAEAAEEPEAEIGEEPAAEAEAEEAEAPEAPTPDEAEPVDAGVPTEAFTLADVREAEAALEQSDDGADLPPTEAMSLGDLLDTGEELEPTGESESVAALFAAEEDSSAPEPEAEPQGDAQDSEAAEAAATEGSANEDELAYAFEGEPSTQTSEYSFPDIQPPEEWRSVFDDPSRGAELAGSDGDFDDLISRAVAQEGSTGSTGVSALILPSHPEDTGGLAGPLGATGDLYVTGSIELPKSIGETGGHASLHDSLEIDPFLTGGQTGSMGADQAEGPVPVSARSAVSARRNPEVPVVAEPTKDKSKMPVVLALTGGGLLIVLAGAAVYMATQGMFG